MISTHYSILGVSPTASEAEIKAAFKKLAKKYHPDKNAGNIAAEETFKKINNAYQVLSDKNKRARYDLILLYQTQKKQTASTNRNTAKPNPSQKQYRSPMASNSSVKQTSNKNTKYAIYVIIAFLLFGTAVLFFSRYMNKITAKERLKEAIAFEQKYKILMAIEYYSQAIDYDPSLTESYTRRAWLRFRFLQDTTGAIADFENGIKNQTEVNYKTDFEYAKFNFKIKKYKEGINYLNSAIGLNKNFDSLYLYKAEVYNYILKDYPEAIKAYDKVLELKKGTKDALFGRALAKQYSGKLVESLKDFNQLIQEAPDNGAFYYYRAWTKKKLGDNDGACTDLKKAIESGFVEAVKELDILCSQ